MIKTITVCDYCKKEWPISGYGMVTVQLNATNSPTFHFCDTSHLTDFTKLNQDWLNPLTGVANVNVIKSFLDITTGIIGYPCPTVYYSGQKE